MNSILAFLESWTGEVDFYQSAKKYLFEEKLFPNSKDSFLEKGNYLSFQKDLQKLSSLSHGMDLAMCLMVEINVARTILRKGQTKCAKHSLEMLSLGQETFATGVSEPNWEGNLKNLKSPSLEGTLTATKSFISNGFSADSILWVLKIGDQFPVYRIPMKSPAVEFQKERVVVPFLPLCNHMKLHLENYHLTSESLVLEDYGDLGIEIRLRELFSLVSLLLGDTERKNYVNLDQSIQFAWKTLEDWRDEVAYSLVEGDFRRILEDKFPFPIKPLLDAIQNTREISMGKTLIDVDPNYQMFVWEDPFTRYLKRKARRNN
ncbi:hypothetical protein LPTSP4_07340 [Leptospira ryugenii]|uniref:Acyl-CoA dehydrogenase, central domain protein n=1 Tax=Leptospira ryugenii TaxID=1917863 RepID=A0A2P2DX64_9LEPT|nr:hypothetical protein LPTSP4_07340 [Leptospira ryugenii]